MRTYLDCIPCFFRQALEASRVAGAGIQTQRRVLNELAKICSGFSLTSSPPETGRIIYRLVSRITGKKDPYAKIKTESNKMALKLYPRLKRMIARSADPMAVAVRLAIAGNIIDYGVKNSLNVGHELEKILKEEGLRIPEENKKFYQYAKFKRTLAKARTVLYLADNSGEVVFDRILIEEIKKKDPWKHIFYAVKSAPTINDALKKDAKQCGIDKVAEIITSGADAPGTVLSLCTPRFLRMFRGADIVISKGQGNFEVLSLSRRPVFFLFMAKCPVVASHAGCRIGDIILRCGGEYLTREG
jgi:damage-control phosphatase, subfamily I